MKRLEKLAKAIAQVEHYKGEDVIVFIHPDAWAKVPEEERLRIREHNIYVEVPSQHDLDMMMLVWFPGCTPEEFWNPDHCFMITRNDWMRKA